MGKRKGKKKTISSKSGKAPEGKNSSLRLIKSKDRVRDVGEVFTPDYLVERMLDLYPSDAWQPEKNWLEPTCGNGQFILAVLRRKLKAGSTLLQALNTTFGADVMKDNVSECHARIYAEMAIPYWTEHKITGEQFKEERLQAACLVESNIRHTKNSLQEDFLHWQHFSDTSQRFQDQVRLSVESALNAIDGEEVPKLNRRIYEELLSLRDLQNGYSISR
jgi:hypothetical protein